MLTRHLRRRFALLAATLATLLLAPAASALAAPTGPQAVPGAQSMELQARQMAAQASQAAPDTYWSLHSKPVTFTRAGKAYNLKLNAYQTDYANGTTSGLSVYFDVFQVSDPAGPARATQHHQWSFYDPTGVFTHSATLASGSLFSGNHLDPYGRVDLELDDLGALKERCGGDVRSRTVELSGISRLETGTPLLGDIKKVPLSGTLRAYDSNANCPGGGGTPNACPAPYRAVYGSRGGVDDMYLSAYRNDGASTASVYTGHNDQLVMSDATVFGWVDHWVQARLPVDNVKIAANLGTAIVTGKKGTWLRGIASFAPQNALTEGTPQPCGAAGNKEYVFKNQDGKLTGTLRANFFVGPAKVVGGTGLQGAAYKLLVRPI